MKPIPAHPGYFAEVDGTILSDRLCGQPVQLRPFIRSRYLAVNVYSGSRGSIMHRQVHQLVLEAFVGPSRGRQARHLDGDRLNNHAANLRWGTAKENQQDRRRHGTAPIGEANGRAVLTENDVAEIRALSEAGLSDVAIASAYPVVREVIRLIRLNKLWPHTR